MKREHDWKRIVNPEYIKDNTENLYDDVDMKHSYSAGFWIGAIAGVFGAIFMCALVGLYYNGGLP